MCPSLVENPIVSTLLLLASAMEISQKYVSFVYFYTYIFQPEVLASDFCRHC
jgi:hypothetical protein